jgi:hypothetical protein
MSNFSSEWGGVPEALAKFAKSKKTRSLATLGLMTTILAVGGERAFAQDAEPTPNPDQRYTARMVGNPTLRISPDRQAGQVQNMSIPAGAQLEITLVDNIEDDFQWARVWSYTVGSGQNVRTTEIPENQFVYVAVGSVNNEGELDGQVIFVDSISEIEPEVIAAPEAPTDSPEEVETSVPPTEAPMVLNEPQITGTPESGATEIMSRAYDSELGGYTVEVNGQTLVYREGLQRVEMIQLLPRDGEGNTEMPELTGDGPLGDAVVADRYVTTNGLGTMTLEAPAMWRDLPYAEQNNALSFTGTPESQQNLENGMREFWLTMYQRAFGVDEAAAAEMLANDEVIEIHWTTNTNLARVRDIITPDIERILQVRPSMGVSFVVTPDAIDYYFDAWDVNPYPMIAPTAFYERSENDIANGLLPPADTFGFDASPDGRLIIYTEKEASDNGFDSLGLGYQIVGALTHAYDFVGEDGNRGVIDSMYLTNPRKPQQMTDLALAMGIGDMNWSNAEYYSTDLNAPIYTTATPFNLDPVAAYERD